MQIIEQGWAWEQKPVGVLETLERAGRVCYKSEDKITPDSARKFVSGILKSGHHSVIEHISASVRFITNRGVTHELVRHRLAAYSQESTRYVRYDGNMEFIRPVWIDTKATFVDDDYAAYPMWKESMEESERAYKAFIDYGWRPEQARGVLPNDLKTEIVMTANLREWMHVFKLRCSAKAHPQIRELMISCREGFRKEIPVIFDEVPNG